MEKSQFKRILEMLLVDSKDESTNKKIKDILKELDTATDTSSLSDPGKVPKLVLKKGVDVISRLFIKLAEYKTVRWIWEILDEIDLDI